MLIYNYNLSICTLPTIKLNFIKINSVPEFIGSN